VRSRHRVGPRNRAGGCRTRVLRFCTARAAGSSSTRRDTNGVGSSLHGSKDRRRPSTEVGSVHRLAMSRWSFLWRRVVIAPIGSAVGRAGGRPDRLRRDRPSPLGRTRQMRAECDLVHPAPQAFRARSEMLRLVPSPRTWLPEARAPSRAAHETSMGMPPRRD
jgi:hypothetical protein